jgi:membrane-associated protease RseP (regulator of RpoE activity)
MHFKIKSVTVNISFTFFAVILLIICFETNDILLISLVSSLFHELVHIIFILICGGEIGEFSLALFGAKISRKQNLKMTNIKESIISLSAPATNIIVGALMHLLGYEIIGIVNITIGIFNILPFYDFDGGRGLFYILSNHLDHLKIVKIINTTSVLSVILIATFTVTLFFNQKNGISMLFLNIYMIFSLFKNISSENL